MSSTVETPATPANYKVTLPRVVKSEWIKLRTLRSTYWTLIIAVALMVGLGVLFCWGVAATFDANTPEQQEAIRPQLVGLPTGGMLLAQLAMGVLGVLTFSGEYPNQMIRATFAAVPKRLPVLWAKLIAFGIAAFLSMFIATLAAFLIGQAILSTKDLGVSLGSPGSWQAVLGTAVYLTGIGLMGVGLGAILRRTPAAISALVGLVLILPIMLNILPFDWTKQLIKYLPDQAGQSFMSSSTSSDALSMWTGVAVFCAYIVVFAVGAALLLKRRDA